VAGHSGQFTPGGYLSTVKHTPLGRSNPQPSDYHATSSANETIVVQWSNWMMISLHQNKSKMIFGSFYTYRQQIHFTSETRHFAILFYLYVTANMRKVT